MTHRTWAVKSSKNHCLLKLKPIATTGFSLSQDRDSLGAGVIYAKTRSSVTIRRLSTILPTGSEMMYSSYVERNTQTQMTFIDGLIASGYVLDEENFDEGCYVKTDADGFIHIYQIGEDEGEWNYVKMTEDYDVLTEKTFTI
jgi:hypothetical protein